MTPPPPSSRLAPLTLRLPPVTLRLLRRCVVGLAAGALGVGALALGAGAHAGWHGLAAEPVSTSGAPLTLTPGGHYVVEARINNAGPYQFIIDTGAQTSVIAQPIAEALGLASDGAPVLVHGVTKSSFLPSYRVPTLRLGGHVFHDLPVVAAPVSEDSVQAVDGVLGADVIDAFALDIDLRNRTVSLIDGDVPILRGDVTRARFRRSAGGLPIVQARLNGRFTSALIDTGLNTSLVSPGFARFARAEQIALTGTLRDVTNTEAAVTHAAVGRLKVEGLAWTRAAMGIYDSPVLDRLDPSARPEIIIGSDLLRGHRVIIDYRTQEVILVRAPTGVPAAQYARS